jgi:hypothetical protein
MKTERINKCTMKDCEGKQQGNVKEKKKRKKWEEE